MAPNKVADRMTYPLGALLAVLALIIPLPAAAFNFVPSAEPKPAPEVSFQDAAGNPVTLAGFPGPGGGPQPLGHLVRALPARDALARSPAGPCTVATDLEVVALSIDRGELAQIESFYAEVGIQHLKIYRDPKAAVSRALGAFGLPTTVVFDQQGREVGRLLGPAEWDSAEAIAMLEALITDAAEGDWGGKQAAKGD